LNSLFTLPLADGAKARILQITDTHLFASENDTLLGVNTFRSYHAVLDAIMASQREVDLIAATGDLAQDQTLAAYQHFVDGINQLSTPCVWLPGNHDFQPAMVKALEQTGIYPSKQVLLGNHWQIVLLDTQVPGVPHGELSEQQFEWLTQCLEQYPKRFTLIMLHHHPLPSGCTWLDQHSLRNAHTLATLLQNYPRVTTLLCGHIHQELDLDWHGKRMLATPSTCVQFKSHCTNFTLDSLSPGWRYLNLYPDGRVVTEVCRLDSDEFRPDSDSEGY